MKLNVYGRLLRSILAMAEIINVLFRHIDVHLLDKAQLSSFFYLFAVAFHTASAISDSRLRERYRRTS